MMMTWTVEEEEAAPCNARKQQLPVNLQFQAHKQTQFADKNKNHKKVEIK